MSEVPLYRVTSLIRHRVVIGPFSRTLLRALRWFYGGPKGRGLFLMSDFFPYTLRLTAFQPRIVTQDNHRGS